MRLWSSLLRALLAAPKLRLLPVAGTAFTPALGVDVQVIASVRVALRTMGGGSVLRCQTLASQDIRPRRDGFQVGYIDAPSMLTGRPAGARWIGVVAQMIQVVFRGNRAVHQFVGSDVGADSFSPDAEPTVAEMVGLSCPEETPVRLSLGMLSQALGDALRSWHIVGLSARTRAIQCPPRRDHRRLRHERRAALLARSFDARPTPYSPTVTRAVQSVARVNDRGAHRKHGGALLASALNTGSRSAAFGRLTLHRVPPVLGATSPAVDAARGLLVAGIIA